jgi:hypothetical protein
VSAPAAASPGRNLSWVDIVSTLLLALAAVATAWSGYQAARWNGEQSKDAARVNALRIEAARQDDLANTQTQVDVATFIQWVEATANEDAQLADFYELRFREEFKPAFAAWLATEPLANEDAPLTPFALPEYQLAAREEVEQLDADAEAKAAEVREDIQRSTNYVLAVVLFSVALFFAGISTRLASGWSRVAILSLGCVIFIGTLAWILTFPVNFSV